MLGYKGNVSCYAWYKKNQEKGDYKSETEKWFFLSLENQGGMFSSSVHPQKKNIENLRALGKASNDRV